jgi:hypothetical protein
MMIPEVENSRDYNRGLPWAVRLVHHAWAVVMWVLRPLREWVGNPSRRAWTIPVLWGALGAVVVYRWDGSVAEWIKGVSSFGPGAASAMLGISLLACVVSAPVVMSRPGAGRATAVRWAAGFIALFLITRVMPMVVGRPRPVLEDPGYFVSPFGQYPLSPAVGIRHAWEFWVPGISDLWSMPSREVAYALFAAWTIGAVRPTWRAWMVMLVVAAVGAVVMSGTVYASDVVVGAALGIAVARVVLVPEEAQSNATALR